MTSAIGKRGSPRSVRFHAVIYLSLFPVLIPLSPPHPLSIASNVILAPVLSVVLFPITLVGYLLPSLTSSTDAIWRVVAFGVQQLDSVFPRSGSPIAITLPAQASYLAVLTIFLLVRECSIRKNVSPINTTVSL